MTIHQQVTFECSAKQLFSILSDAQLFTEVTGAEAVFDVREGGEFSAFNRMIDGQFIEIDVPTRIVQTWRVANWQAGVSSQITFALEPNGDEQTTLSFEHSGYPAEFEQHLAQGWHDRYWEPIKKFITQQKH